MAGYDDGVSVTEFRPVQAERVHETVARQIRQAILSGKYRPGDRLPVERELVESFRVSRSAVRQAILLLHQQGLLDVRQGSGGGAFVRDTGLQPVLHAIENVIGTRQITPGQFFAAKLTLEPVITAAAAEHVTPEILDRLRASVASGRQMLADHQELMAHAAEFHEIIAEATGNPVLELVLVALVRIAEATPQFQHASEQNWEQILDEHEQLVDAFERRAAEDVHELMVRHLGSLNDIFADPSSPEPGP